jgi:small subunit ribosomal protein S16
MALKIRLQRHGASHRPFYRLVVTEATARRDGRFVEVLGTYEPQAKRATDELNLKVDRIDYWKSVGAKPTDTAASLIRKARREATATEEAAPAAEVKTVAPEVKTVAPEAEVKAPAAEVEAPAAEVEAPEVEVAEVEAPAAPEAKADEAKTEAPVAEEETKADA